MLRLQRLDIIDLRGLDLKEDSASTCQDCVSWDAAIGLQVLQNAVKCARVSLNILSFC